ncbi:hypothetical protein GH714_029667 [Hevea brasiliensis]|uniref:Alpha-ketoglutarate-dependent dioxygenase AlkB-like domain-containing protein n=1 Tax=Hevea brasiliensis TaxID=3981 RepID=A0A6A6KV53_HEVBR|nr:hypothetical protein GH714_029667 [Hevea brasiliensis]
MRWIKEGLSSFPQPPNRTNHNAMYGPIHDLFIAAKERKVLVEDENTHTSLDSGSNACVSNEHSYKWKFCEEHVVSSRGKTCKSISASALLRKLRWSTLGLQFDWSKRNYNASLPHNKIPDALCQLAKRLAAPAMLMGEEFHPEAAIVNYFGLGDMLGVTWMTWKLIGKLLVADCILPLFSLGCKAIFLLGGKSREDPPLAMFLRSGDVVLMAGEAESAFMVNFNF